MDHVTPNDWLQHLLDNRADKDWTPVVKASSDVTQEYPTIAGFPTVEDPDLPGRSVVVFRDGEEVASLRGVHLNFISPTSVEGGEDLSSQREK